MGQNLKDFLWDLSILKYKYKNIFKISLELYIVAERSRHYYWKIKVNIVPDKNKKI